MPPTHLIHLIPDGTEVLFDHVALKLGISDTDLHIRVTLPLHHAPHQVVLCNQTLTFQKDDSQEPLLEGKGRFNTK